PNFRQKEFCYPYPFKRLKKPLATYFALAGALAAALFFFGRMSTAEQKEAIEQNYYALVKSEGKNLSDFSVPSTYEEYFASLDFLEKDVRNRPDTFPLLPQVPKVKEVMSWIISLPEIQNKEGPLIEIDSLHYQMVKYPDFAHKKERYRVRVDLEVSA